jgi:hypothetical protein
LLTFLASAFAGESAGKGSEGTAKWPDKILIVFLKIMHAVECKTNNKCIRNKAKYQDIADQLNEKINSDDDLKEFRTPEYVYTPDQVDDKWYYCKKRMFPRIWDAIVTPNAKLPSGSDCENPEAWVDPTKVESNPIWALVLELFGMNRGYGLRAKMDVDDTLRSHITSATGLSEAPCDLGEVTSPNKGEKQR